MRWILVTCACLVPACVPEGQPPLHNHSGVIGDPCSIADDCLDGFFCMTGNFFDNPSVDTPGGYCTFECSNDGECQGQRCERGLATASYCALTCSDSSECRAQYACFGSGSGFCEPSMYLNCDPSVLSCNTGGSSPGACLRLAIGAGTNGVCRAECQVGEPQGALLSCDSDNNCTFFNDAPDPFTGTACWPLAAAPIMEGSPCTFGTACVRGDQCVNSLCRRLCNPKQGLGCPTGTTCQDTFNELSSTTFPVGVCL